MKFTKAQKARLKALLEIAAKKITAEEKTELTGLKEAATAAGFDYNVEDKAPEEDHVAKSVSDDDLAKIVNEASAKALSDAGVDGNAIIAAIKAGGKAVTAETINAEMTKALGAHKLDGSVVEAAVAKALAAHKPEASKDSTTMTTEQMKALVTEIATAVAKSIPRESRMEHAGSVHEFELPISHRSGNLSVASKQLLNICMKESTCDLKPGEKRPQDMNEGITAEQLATAARAGTTHLKSMRDGLRRKLITTGGTGTTGPGYGLELMPIDLSSELYMRLYMDSRLATEMISQEIEMPSDPFRLPLLTTRTTFTVGSQGVAAPESTPGFANPTLTTAKLIGMSSYSYEADEDSILAILPMMMQQMAAAAADALETAMINGDTTATHQDSDINAVANHAAKAFKGLRYYALASAATKTSLASGGITALNIASIRKLLKKYGMKPKDLLIVCGTDGYNDLVTLAETLTAEKMGNPQAARIISGDAPALYGIPIIPSAQNREDLNASGVYDGTTTTKGSILIVHRPSWILGVRRHFMVEVFRDVKLQVNNVVGSFRRAFIPLETPSATVPNVGIGYNYTSASA